MMFTVTIRHFYEGVNMEGERLGCLTQLKPASLNTLRQMETQAGCKVIPHQWFSSIHLIGIERQRRVPWAARCRVGKGGACLSFPSLAPVVQLWLRLYIPHSHQRFCSQCHACPPWKACSGDLSTSPFTAHSCSQQSSHPQALVPGEFSAHDLLSCCISRDG